MTRRIFLHVGMPKCASTTIQAHLGTHAGWLRGHGVDYVQSWWRTPVQQGNAVRLGYRLFDGDMRNALGYAARLGRKRQDVLLSTELFSALSGSARMGDFIDALGQAGFEPHVICLFRRQDLWLESDFKQQVKEATGWTGTLDDLLARRIDQQALNYTRAMRFWERHLGGRREACHGLLIHPGQPPEKALTDLLGVLLPGGVPGDMPPLDENRNTSPPTVLIEPGRRLKIALQAMNLPKRRAARVLRRFFAWRPEGMDLPKQPFLLPLDRRRALVAKFRDSNRELADYTGGDTFDDSFGPDRDVPHHDWLALYLDHLAAGGRAGRHLAKRLRRHLPPP